MDLPASRVRRCKEILEAAETSAVQLKVVLQDEHIGSCFLFHGRCSWNVGNGLFQQLIYYYLLLDINDTFGQMPTYHGMLFCFVRTKVKHRRRSYETWANCPLSFWQRRRLVWQWTNFPRRTFLLKNWNKNSFPLVKNGVRTPINGLIV